MVRARRRFLSQGYYSHLLETLCTAVSERMPSGGTLLDAGCGEGFYTRGMREHLKQSGIQAECCGVDISKTAADLAARADKETTYAVGSVFHLPVQSASCDVVTSVFAPYCGEEFLRVLKPKGYLILAIPAAKHLWEMKEAVYATPYENEVKDYALEGFSFVKCCPSRRRIALECRQDILDLFSMTPYAYRTKPVEQKRLEALETLEVQTAFEVLVYQKVKETRN